MIRFINLTNQITDEQKEFAFYNTVSDTFMVFNDEHTFTSVDYFKKCCDDNLKERCLQLIPNIFLKEEK
jgi:hypothetical protein